MPLLADFHIKLCKTNVHVIIVVALSGDKFRVF